MLLSLIICWELCQNQGIQKLVIIDHWLTGTLVEIIMNAWFLVCCQIKSLFPLCKHLILQMMEHFSAACLYWKWILLLSHASLGRSKVAVGVYMGQLWFSWREQLVCELLFLVRDSSVVMTCLNPLACVSPYRLRNTISKLFTTGLQLLWLKCYW